MLFIRALHHDKFNIDKKRFDSDTFKNYRGGISVVGLECAVLASKSILKHLETFYCHLIGTPVFFFEFDLEFIKSKHSEAEIPNLTINPEPSTSGDECHYNMVGLPDKQAIKFVKNYFRPPHIFVCCGNENIELTQIEFEQLNLYHCN